MTNPESAITDLYVSRRLAPEQEQPDERLPRFLGHLTTRLSSLGRSGAIPRRPESMHVTYVASQQRVLTGSGGVTPNDVRAYARRFVEEYQGGPQLLAVNTTQPLQWVGSREDRLALNLEDTDGSFAEGRAHLQEHLEHAFGALPPLEELRLHLSLGRVFALAVLENDPSEFLDDTPVPGTLAVDDWYIEINRIQGLGRLR